MNLDDLTIGQAKQLAAMFPAAPTEPCVDDRGLIRIVVLQRGWVAVGKFFQHGDVCELRSASVIRRWGTNKGLGEIAAKGLLADTILDPAGTLRFHALSIVCQFDCAQERWDEKCR